MPFRVDLHVHTRHSGDNEADPVETVEVAIRLGLDGLAFTEHYSYEASEYADELRRRYINKIAIIRGVELSAMEGHLLVFGLNTDRLGLSRAPAAHVVKAVAREGGVVIPSHPFRGGSGIGELLEGLGGICALEGYNGCNIHPMNIRAVEAASRLGLPYTGGSDAHAPREVGSCHTLFNVPVTQDNIVEALRAGHYSGHDTRKISLGFQGFFNS